MNEEFKKIADQQINFPLLQELDAEVATRLKEYLEQDNWGAALDLMDARAPEHKDKVMEFIKTNLYQNGGTKDLFTKIAESGQDTEQINHLKDMHKKLGQEIESAGYNDQNESLSKRRDEVARRLKSKFNVEVEASNKDLFTKIAAKREARSDEIYSIDEDMSAYGPNCPEHIAVRREPLGLKEKRAKGYSSTDVAWKCPVDGKIFHAEGSIGEQTHGFSEHNNLHRNVEPIIDDGFDAANKLAKAMGYSDGLG